MRVRRSFTINELKSIRDMSLVGFSSSEIGAWLGRKPQTIENSSSFIRNNSSTLNNMTRWRRLWKNTPFPSNLTRIDRLPVLEEIGDWNSLEWRQ